MLCQLFLPVPHIVAQCGRYAKFIVQANLCNAVNLANAFIQLKQGVVVQAALYCRQNELLAQAHTTRTAHCQYERKAKLSEVSRIELGDVGQLIWRALRQACFVLFVGRFGC